MSEVERARGESKFWSIVICMTIFIIFFYLVGLESGKNQITDYMQETDGFNTYNYICHHKSDLANRTQYIIDHELCHDIVYQEKEDYCT